MSIIENALEPSTSPKKDSPESVNYTKSPQADESRGRVHAMARLFVILLFGVVLPVFVLWQAYQALGTLRTDISGKPTDVVRMFGDFKKLTTESTIADDYALFSLLYAEQSNKQAIVNKQLLKAVIIQVGFAVISVGLMFIILGISDGGASIGSGGAGYTFDLKTGSTGLVTFIIGALMAAGGALIPNEYQTVGAPEFIQPSGQAVKNPTLTSGEVGLARDGDLVKEYGICKKQEMPEDAIACFMSKFREKYGSLL